MLIKAFHFGSCSCPLWNQSMIDDEIESARIQIASLPSFEETGIASST